MSEIEGFIPNITLNLTGKHETKTYTRYVNLYRTGFVGRGIESLEESKRLAGDSCGWIGRVAITYTVDVQAC